MPLFLKTSVLSLQRPCASHAYKWLQATFDEIVPTPTRTLCVPSLPVHTINKKKMVQEFRQSLTPRWDDLYLHVFSDGSCLMFSKIDQDWRVYPTAISLGTGVTQEGEMVQLAPCNGDVQWTAHAVHIPLDDMQAYIKNTLDDIRETMDKGPLFADQRLDDTPVDCIDIYPLPFTAGIPLPQIYKDKINEVLHAVAAVTGPSSFKIYKTRHATPYARQKALDIVLISPPRKHLNQWIKTLLNAPGFIPLKYRTGIDAISDQGKAALQKSVRGQHSAHAVLEAMAFLQEIEQTYFTESDYKRFSN